ncbi:MAG: hypothetical protein IT258_11470, partial [Saprospiraceae bacterium]|nr:hypothetical protein [Saprospiraceae bacterium]
MVHGEFDGPPLRIDVERAILKPAFRAAFDGFSLSGGGGRPNKEMMRWMRAGTDEIGHVRPANNPDLPAGYTYFGQLLAHDITSNRQVTGANPSLCLNSIYGLGPGLAPYIYQYERDAIDGYRFKNVKLKLDAYKKLDDNMGGKGIGDTVFDFPRLVHPDSE